MEEVEGDLRNPPLHRCMPSSLLWQLQLQTVEGSSLDVLLLLEPDVPVQEIYSTHYQIDASLVSMVLPTAKATDCRLDSHVRHVVYNVVDGSD